MKKLIHGCAVVLGTTALLAGCNAKQPDYSSAASRVEAAAMRAEKAADSATASAKAAETAADRAAAAADKAAARFSGSMRK